MSKNEEQLTPRRPGAAMPIKMEGSFISYPNDPVSQAINLVARRKAAEQAKKDAPADQNPSET